MTRRQFRRLLARREPHPDEAVRFAETQGWTLEVTGAGEVRLAGTPWCDPAAGALALRLGEPAFARRVIQTLEARALLYDGAGWLLVVDPLEGEE